MVGPSYPLQVSANRRYLTDQQGRPVLVHGDTPWSLFSALNEAEVERYLADRVAKGFNALIANLVEHRFNGPLNRQGDPPFTDPLDLSTPNERYFAYADWIVQRAAEYGFLLLLAPNYLGLRNDIDDEGWIHETWRSGAAKCYQYGRFLGERYAHYQHIVWLMGGDRNPRGVVDEVNSLVQGIKAVDHHSLFAASPELEQSTQESYGWGGWLDLNGTYSYAMIRQRFLADYNRRPTMPYVLLSTTYENEHNATALQIRRQGYWAMLCGACGEFLGNYPMWLFDPGWEAALNSPGALERVHLQRLFHSRSWHSLIPDQFHHAVTGGLGEFNGMDALAAAQTADHRTLIAYMPSARRITVDGATLAGERVTGWWFNPRTGESEAAGEFATGSILHFTPPAEGDWALVLDDVALGLPPPGVTGGRYAGG
jgi:hypothetical protein